jgi:hypothetical protein
MNGKEKMDILRRIVPRRRYLACEVDDGECRTFLGRIAAVTCFSSFMLEGQEVAIVGYMCPVEIGCDVYLTDNDSQLYKGNL